PKKDKLTASKPLLTKRVIVQVQNRSGHDEIVENASQLANLVELQVEPFGSSCPPPQVVLSENSLADLPQTLSDGDTLKVFFDVTYACTGDDTLRYTARVDHSALGTGSDAHPEDDVCPRAALPGGIDPNPDGSIKDKG